MMMTSYLTQKWCLKNKNESKKVSIFVVSGIALYSMAMGGSLEEFSESNGYFQGIDCIYRCLINYKAYGKVILIRINHSCKTKPFYKLFEQTQTKKRKKCAF